MVCGATAGATSATYPPRGLVDATKVDAIVDEMVVAIPQSNVSTRWMQPTWKQLCRSCSYTTRAGFRPRWTFWCYQLGEGRKICQKFAARKVGGKQALSILWCTSYANCELTLYRIANSYMKQLRDCSLFAKSLDFRVIWLYLFETEDEVKSRIETPHAECNTSQPMRIYSNLRDKRFLLPMPPRQ